MGQTLYRNPIADNGNKNNNLLAVHYSCGQLRLFLDTTIYRKSLNEYAVTTYTHIPF